MNSAGFSLHSFKSANVSRILPPLFEFFFMFFLFSLFLFFYLFLCFLSFFFFSLRHFTLSVQLSHEETALRFLWIAEPRNICPGSRAPEKRKEKEYERWKRKMEKGRRGRMGGWAKVDESKMALPFFPQASPSAFWRSPWWKSVFNGMNIVIT